LANKIGRNDLCWCGSGRKYKRCHLQREAEERLPFRAFSSKVHLAAKQQICLHPDASRESCGKVISAHTLQRSRVLEAIADDSNHVLTFDPYDPLPNGMLKVHRRGWREASTFSAFCDRHDGITFAPLEASPFSGSKQQIFLIAYRAICWELYQKMRAQKTEPTRRDLLDRGAPEHTQWRIQKNLAVEHAIIDKTAGDLTTIKHNMDHALVTEDYSQYETYEVQLHGPLAVAATGAITPNLLNVESRLQLVQKIMAPMQCLAFGVDLREEGPSVTFLWSALDPAPKQYMKEVKALTDRALAEFLVQLFFVHCENTYFSSSWWQALGESEREFISNLMSNATPYYFRPQYNLGSNIAPWRIVSRNSG